MKIEFDSGSASLQLDSSWEYMEIAVQHSITVTVWGDGSLTIDPNPADPSVELVETSVKKLIKKQAKRVAAREAVR